MNMQNKAIMLPNFICPGAQKAGTSTLFHILKQHPNIFIPTQKETKFFHHPDRWSKGMEWYAEFFLGAGDQHTIIGDMTPEYMYFNQVPPRISKTLGKDVKFVFMLRNPIDRAYSQYWMSVRRGYEELSFSEAIEMEGERIQRGHFEKAHFGYIDRGFYAKQIKRFLQYFSIENMKFIFFEDFVADTEQQVKRILSFLEVPLIDKLDFDVHSNPARMPRSRWLKHFIQSPNSLLREAIKLFIPSRNLRQKVKKALDSINYREIKTPAMSNGIRKELLRLYDRDIQELEILIDRDLTHWREPSSISANGGKASG